MHQPVEELESLNNIRKELRRAWITQYFVCKALLHITSDYTRKIGHPVKIQACYDRLLDTMNKLKSIKGGLKSD